MRATMLRRGRNVFSRQPCRKRGEERRLVRANYSRSFNLNCSSFSELLCCLQRYFRYFFQRSSVEGIFLPRRQSSVMTVHDLDLAIAEAAERKQLRGGRRFAVESGIGNDARQ
jgi:hypothetical protein